MMSFAQTTAVVDHITTRPLRPAFCICHSPGYDYHPLRHPEPRCRSSHTRTVPKNSATRVRTSPLPPPLPSSTLNQPPPSPSPTPPHRAKRALTPILSGAISGGIVGVAWLIGLVVWLYKRHRRARRARAAGYRSYREFLDPPKRQEPFIIPPDPAVIKGQVRPGQKVVVEDAQAAHVKHAKTVPAAAGEGEEEEGEEGEGGRRRHGEKEDVPPGMQHRSSAPCRVPEGESTAHDGTSHTPRHERYGMHLQPAISSHTHLVPENHTNV